MSARYQLTPELRIFVAGTYLDAKYRDYQPAGFFNPILTPDNNGDGIREFAGFSTSTQVNVSGFQIMRAPRFSGTAPAVYSTDIASGKFAASGNLYHTSIFFDAAHQFPHSAYDIVAARVQWTDRTERYMFALFGDNLFDKKYRVQGFGTLSAAGSFRGRPATYGVSLRVKFDAN